jgi:fatty acid desaturase
MGAEMGIVGSILWTAWTAALLVALMRSARGTRWWAAVGIASAFAAAAVLAIQTDVIGDPWMGYVLWMLAGIAVTPPLPRPHEEPDVDDAAGQPAVGHVYTSTSVT